MASRYVLISDDLKNNARGQAYQHSLALRALGIDIAARLKEPLRFVYVDNINERAIPAKDLTTQKIQFWKQTYDRTFFRMKSFFPENTEFILRSGSPAPELLEMIHSADRPELVVMGTRGLKGLKKLFLGSVAEEVLRHSERPVLVVGPSAVTKALQFHKLKKLKILLLTDLEKTSRAAEQYAASFAKRTGAKLTLCHSVGDQIQKIKANIYSSGYVPFDLDQTLRDMRDEARSTLEKKRDRLLAKGLEVTSKLILLENPLDLSIQNELKSGYDLIVMGTHSRGALMTGLLGSSARRTLLSAPIPVMIIKSI